MSRLTPSIDFDAIAFYHRVRQQLVGDFGRQPSRLRGFGRLQIELEVLALAHVLDAAVPERMERVGDRLALRAEDQRLQRDAHARTPQEPSANVVLNTRPKMSSTYLN